MSAIEKAIKVCGRAVDLAEKLGVVPMAITQWKRRGVPADRCVAIETATNGAVTRYELRPDVFGTDPSLQQKAA